MEGLEDVHSVQQGQVLGGFAAPDEDLAAAVSHGHHAGLRGKIIDKVAGYAGRGDQFDVLGKHPLLSRRNARGAGFAFGLDHDFVHGGLSRGQRNVHVPRIPCGKLERVREGFESDKGSLQDVSPRRDAANQVYPVGIGYAPKERFVLPEDDVYALERLSVVLRRDESAHGGGLLRMDKRRRQRQRNRGQPGKKITAVQEARNHIADAFSMRFFLRTTRKAISSACS